MLLAKAYCETDRHGAARPKLSEVAEVSATAIKSCALLHGLGKNSVGTELAKLVVNGKFPLDRVAPDLVSNVCHWFFFVHQYADEVL